jgi:hypothetical protein
LTTAVVTVYGSYMLSDAETAQALRDEQDDHREVFVPPLDERECADCGERACDVDGALTYESTQHQLYCPKCLASLNAWYALEEAS